MHCNRSLSATLLPAIIKGYRDRGFRFVTVEQLITRSWARTSGTSANPLDPSAPAAPDPALDPAAWLLAVTTEVSAQPSPVRQRSR
jgi:hypothetical protein